MQVLKTVVGLVGALVLVACMIQPGHCQGSRPASVIFEPTLSFIRQNVRLVQSYIALLRSIYVGAYERPLITSTDGTVTSITSQPPQIPSMEFPRRRLQPQANRNP